MSQLRDKKLITRIAKGVRELRLEKEVTQGEFYAKTRIHIARIEAGKTNLSVSTLQLICKYFDVSMHEFFGRIER